MAYSQTIMVINFQKQEKNMEITLLKQLNQKQKSQKLKIKAKKT